MNKRLRNKILLLFIILFFAVLLGIFKGSVNIVFTELLLKENQPILNLRILRILMGIMAGSGLAVSGIALQAILRNSLAEPYLLGTSSGAGLGAVIAVVMGVSGMYLPAAAFLGAILSIILVYNLAKQNNKILPQSLILSGVIVSVAFSAIIVFLISVSGSEALHGMIWWLCKTAGLMKPARAVICLIALALFLLIVPPRAPTIRAAIICCVFCISILLSPETRHATPLSAFLS